MAEPATVTTLWGRLTVTFDPSFIVGLVWTGGILGGYALAHETLASTVGLVVAVLSLWIAWYLAVTDLKGGDT